MTTTNDQVRIQDVITDESKTPFKPEQPIANVPTHAALNDVGKRDFILAVNAVRLGLAKVEVAVTYEIQVGKDLRTEETDYVAIPGVPNDVHVGPMTTATFNRDLEFYIRVCDAMRSTGLKRGWTSMRATGIKSFKVLTMEPGPIFNGGAPANTTTPMEQMFKMVYDALVRNIGK